MEPESLMLSDISQRKTNTMISLTSGFKKQNKTKKQTNKKRIKGKKRQTKEQTLNYGEQTDGYQRGGGWAWEK